MAGWSLALPLAVFALAAARRRRLQEMEGINESAPVAKNPQKNDAVRKERD
jgi:hypothetical protein